MSFRDQLTAVLTAVEGSIACSLMGFDGVGVETAKVPAQAGAATALDVETAWIEFGNVLSQLKSASETLKTGPVQEVSVNSENLIALMRMVTPEYFVVLALLPSGNYGKARYALRLAAPKLKAEL